MIYDANYINNNMMLECVYSSNSHVSQILNTWNNASIYHIKVTKYINNDKKPTQY